MSKKTFKLTKRTRRAYTTATVFIVFFCLFLIFSLVYNQSILAYKYLDAFILLVCFYNGIFFYLSLAKTHLEVTDSTIELVTPYGSRRINCADAIKLENTPAKFALVYKHGATRSNLLLDLLIKRDRIPLSLFVENWVDDRAWKEDPLLLWINAHFQINKGG